MNDIKDNSLRKQEIIEKLKANGLKITKQRMIILQLVLNGNFSCCKEIYYQASQIDSKIGMATVYRMINVLEEIGEINRNNIYQIGECSNCEAVGSCKVELEDDTVIELSETKWHQIMNVGLTVCGYIKDKKIKNVTIS